MKRRTFVAGMAAVMAAPLAGEAQQAGRVYRIGVLAPGPAPHLTDSLVAALRDRGWIVGRNLVVEIRLTHGDPGRAEALTRAFARDGIDVIVTNITATAMASRRATTRIPIVMAASGFPVEGGLAESLARPGGNVTGMTIYAGGGGLFGKFVELLREVAPSLRELGVLWGYAPPSYKMEQVAPAVEELRRAAKAVNANVRFWQTGTESDLDTALAAGAGGRLDALFVTSGVIHGLPDITPKIIRFAVQRRLPILTDFAGPFFGAGGAVLAYSAEVKELADRTADFIDRILKGAQPGELPIEQPTRYRLIINRKAANAIGVTIPPSLLLRADQVIE